MRAHLLDSKLWYLAPLIGIILAACQARIPFTATQAGGAGQDVAPSQAATATVLPATGLADQPAANFGFTFEYSVCYQEVFDSFEQTFRREVGTDPAVVIPAALSDEQMRMVYEKLVEIDFLSYPPEYRVPTPESGTVVEVMPAYRYRLTVRNGDVMHSVDWEDNIVDPINPETWRLRELFMLIRGMVRALPAVEELPAAGIGCV